MKLYIFLITGISLAFAAAADASVTLDQNYIAYIADDGDFNYSFLELTDFTLPTHRALNNSDGAAYSNNSVDWYDSSGQTIFSLASTHGRPGTHSARAETYQSIYFIADSDEPYNLSGFYDVTDLGEDQSNTTGIQTWLYDVTDSVILYMIRQTFDLTHNAHFALVDTGADGHFLNFQSGSLTGTLTAGHTYEFFHSSSTWVANYTDAGASAVGNVTLTIGSVPEPSTLLLLGIGAFSLLGYRKRTL